jgi:hypothetical protein
MRDQQSFTEARDRRGRWSLGVSGNPAGRPKGSRNRWRRADRRRAAEWTAGEWKLHFARAMRMAQGDLGERTAAAAAAFAECLGQWQVLNPPRAQPGLCAECGRPLDPPNATYDAAPIRIEGVFVHWACARQFAYKRWQEAKQALSRFGIRS